MPDEFVAKTAAADHGPLTVAELVDRCQLIFAHAWMVRTFVKHSDVVEDFPELMGIVRAVFDASRALEPKVGDPPAYLATLRKKIGKLRQATHQFSKDAPLASDHTNFRQAVISMNACLADWEGLLKKFPLPAPPAIPANFRQPTSAVNVVAVDEHSEEGQSNEIL